MQQKHHSPLQVFTDVLSIVNFTRDLHLPIITQVVCQHDCSSANNIVSLHWASTESQFKHLIAGKSSKKWPFSDIVCIVRDSIKLHMFLQL